MLAFNIDIRVNAEPLPDEEIKALLASDGGLTSLRGQSVEAHKEQLSATPAH